MRAARSAGSRVFRVKSGESVAGGGAIVRVAKGGLRRGVKSGSWDELETRSELRESRLAEEGAARWPGRFMKRRAAACISQLVLVPSSSRRPRGRGRAKEVEEVEGFEGFEGRERVRTLTIGADARCSMPARSERDKGLVWRLGESEEGGGRRVGRLGRVGRLRGVEGVEGVGTEGE
jgi:hypothetical protein